MVIDGAAGTVPTVRTVLVLGQSDRAEMRPLMRWLKEWIGDAHRWATDRQIDGIVGKADEFPDLIVVFQSWSNEFTAEEVNRLLAWAPLARLVVCYGAWCESDGRNHKCWPLSVRVPVWAAKGRIEREWRLIQAASDLVPLPWSASREEVFAADHPPIVKSRSPQRVLIDSPDQAYRSFLIEQLTEEGHSVVDDDPTVLIFDADPWGNERADALRKLRQRSPTARLIAVTSLSQPPLDTELFRLSVQKVVPKLGNSWDELSSES